ncbi:MAG: hypothetical protein L7H02_04660 [Sulfolobales archaeon]|nr:hypothetical protein [Sulfolobales archaeon]MCG2893996.1 hypothetical protein [Sulfolobales archaeon]
MAELSKINSIIRNLPKVLESLASPDPEARARAWDDVKFLVDTGNVRYLLPHRGYLRSLLWHRLQGVRDDAWSNLELMKSLGVEGIERTLTANKDTIKWSAWRNYRNLLSLGIISFDTLREVRISYWRLLKSRWATVRKKSWRLFVDLVKDGVFTAEDRERYKDFLRARKASVRILAWEKAKELADLGFISLEELRELKDYLLELTRFESSVSRRAKRVAKALGFL